MGVAIRDAAPTDEDFILALNAASTPAVGEMALQTYRDIAAQAYRVLADEGCHVAICGRTKSTVDESVLDLRSRGVRKMLARA